MVSQTLAFRLGREWIWRAGKEAQGWGKTSARLHSCQSAVGRSLGGEGQRVAWPSGVYAAELHAQGCTVVRRYQSLPRLCSCQLPSRNAPGHCWCIDPRLLCFLLCGYCMVLFCSTRRGISLLLTGHVWLHSSAPIVSAAGGHSAVNGAWVLSLDYMEWELLKMCHAFHCEPSGVLEYTYLIINCSGVF